MIKQVLVENFSNFTNRMVRGFLSACGRMGNDSEMRGLHVTTNRDTAGPFTGCRSVRLKTAQVFKRDVQVQRNGIYISERLQGS